MPIGLIAGSLALAAFVILANDEATWVVQSLQDEVRVIHDKGLTGAGQIVTMADGAPWVGHPAFADANHPFDCEEPAESVGPLHRKIHGWLTIYPTQTCESTHGTHDAGSILGDGPPHGAWNGMDGHAFGARLIVADLGAGQDVPLSPIEDIYEPSYDLGSRIISNGYGTVNDDQLNYCIGAEKSDLFAWENKDYLIVAGAGNEGHRTCVGSGLPCATSADCPRETCIGVVGICQGTQDPCSGPGTCPQGQPCLVNVEGSCAQSGADCFDDTACPLEQCTGSVLFNVRCESQAKNIITVGASGNGAQAESAASFTSWGPAADGRLKPTLMAPGVGICSTTTSAFGWDPNAPDPNSTSCLYGVPHYRRQSGTSFAHPIVSGSAALVREYFTEGWYPSGVEGGSPPLAPSAALLKAVMINGAQEMTGSSAYTSAGNRRYPNVVQGWGRLHLDNALYFSGDQRKLVVCQDQAGFTAAGQQRQVTFNVTGSQVPFEATLVWTDPPGDSGNPSAPQLVNDLDLLVTAPGGNQYLGNVFQGAAPGQSATGGSADRVNVEENVLRYGPQTGNWTVKVSAYDNPEGSQPFALAVTGSLSLTAGGYIDAAAEDDSGPGVIFQGDYTSTWTSNDVYEVLRETSGGLSHIWRFDAVPCTTSRHLLHLEGNRPANSDGDNFQFYYSTDGENFSLIPGAVINKMFEPVGGLDLPFGDAGLMGTIYIQVRDTVGGGEGSLAKVNIDHLEIR